MTELRPADEEGRMTDDSIRGEDLRVDVERSGVYPNNTCAVRITHLPTGIVVCCDEFRSEIQNKDRALKELRRRIDPHITPLEPGSGVHQYDGQVTPNEGGGSVGS